MNEDAGGAQRPGGRRWPGGRPRPGRRPAGLTSLIQLGQWVAPANPSSPQFQPALKACQHVLPMRPPTAAALQQQLRREVHAAVCMRSHGYPDYPDPSVQDGHMVRLQTAGRHRHQLAGAPGDGQSLQWRLIR